MKTLRIAFLCFALIATSGYTFRCYIFCTDQTSTQTDYIEIRDRCRQDAQLKLDTNSTTIDDKAKRAQLSTYFTECMAQNGWSAPEANEKPAPPAASAAAASTPAHAGETAAPAAAAAAATATAAATGPTADEKAALARASECAFARQSADVSTIAAARAKACDLECEQYLRSAPEAPRPAACPAETNEGLANGTEKE